MSPTSPLQFREYVRPSSSKASPGFFSGGGIDVVNLYFRTALLYCGNFQSINIFLITKCFRWHIRMVAQMGGVGESVGCRSGARPASGFTLVPKTDKSDYNPRSLYNVRLWQCSIKFNKIG